MASVDSSGKFKQKPTPSFPSWYSVKRINWVQGKTLERLQVQEPPKNLGTPAVGQQITVVVKLPTPRMTQLGCDRCVGPHESTNVACSATLGLETSMSDPHKFYDFYTGLAVEAEWALVANVQRRKYV